jgi:hypothetical protein
MTYDSTECFVQRKSAYMYKVMTNSQENGIINMFVITHETFTNRINNKQEVLIFTEDNR